MRNLITNKWFRFIIVATAYLLWVIWLANYWWLIGLIIIFDIYISKKIHWAFWKKKNPPNGKQKAIVEWVDAIIFAVIAATFIRSFFIEAYTIPTPSMEKSMLVGDFLFVSKTSYGPRVPETPLSFPFVHHTLPLTKNTPSYSTLIKNDYRRLTGFGNIERDDVVVFNFPEGDTVASNFPADSYYSLCRSFGRDAVLKNKRQFGDILVRPVDKCENYIKRCVAIAGDKLEIIDGQVYVNGEKQTPIQGVQYKYLVQTNGSGISRKTWSELDVAKRDYEQFGSGPYQVPLTEEAAKKLSEIPIVTEVRQLTFPSSAWDKNVFPFSQKHPWNVDNYGPLSIPKKGETIELSINNLPLYHRIITAYEHHDLKVDGNNIYIDGQIATSYTFSLNYYWMMGDNRHNSADSRYWGFVPETHIVGKAVFIWLSLDAEKGFPANVRWSRLFSKVI